MNKEFKKELTELINRYGIENCADMPDYLLAEMICNMIEGIGKSVKKTLDWHGCNSICHPKKNLTNGLCLWYNRVKGNQL